MTPDYLFLARIELVSDISQYRLSHRPCLCSAEHRLPCNIVREDAHLHFGLRFVGAGPMDVPFHCQSLR